MAVRCHRLALFAVFLLCVFVHARGRGRTSMASAGEYTVSANRGGSDEAEELDEAESLLDVGALTDKELQQQPNALTLDSAGKESELGDDSNARWWKASSTRAPTNNKWSGYFSGKSDEPNPAQCKQTLPESGLTPGSRDCIPKADMCYLTDGVGRTEKDCKVGWEGKAPTCPDGIGPDGVFLTGNSGMNMCARWTSSQLSGNNANCDKKFESVTDSNGVSYKRLQELTCTKAQVTHANMASKMSGMLMIKRTHCSYVTTKPSKGKTGQKGDTEDVFSCEVFKTGLCIDVGKDIWPHYWNTWINTWKTSAREFATEATKLLKLYPDGLPEKHQCKNNRHSYEESCGNKQVDCLCFFNGDSEACATKAKTDFPDGVYKGGCCREGANNVFTMKDEDEYSQTLLTF